MTTEQPPPKQMKLSEVLLQPTVLFRFGGLLILLQVLALSLGIAFFIILIGLWIGLRPILFFWQPAEDLLRRVLSVPSETIEIVYPPVNWVKAISIVIRIAFGLYFANIGISLLVKDGFCAQNLFFTCGW